MDVTVVETLYDENVTFVCTLSSSETMTRWAYLSGFTGTLLMSYQNRNCTVTPSGSFLINRTYYSYTCNSSVHQVSIHAPRGITTTNHIMDCRGVHQNSTRSAWIIKKNRQANGTCSYCEPKVTFDVTNVNEGDHVNFVCRVYSGEPIVNWDRNIGSNTAAMSIHNGQCITSPNPSYLDNTTTKYIYNCNNTVYQVTRLNVQRSEHNDMYMCTTQTQQHGQGSNWIMKIKGN
ncbi:hypothetical protein ACF0H5_019410 [Mactra antiquata]